MIIDVELFYYRSDEPGGEGTWYAEWAPQGADESTEDQATDLAELVKGIVADVRLGGGASLNWQFEAGGGDLSPAETKQLVDSTGVTLPTSV